MASYASADRPAIALSDLSATEFVTLARMGFLPHGLVVGVSVYDAGMDMTSLNFLTQEMKSLGRAMHNSRANAVEKMRQQAEDLGAEGVVGVRLDVNHHRWRGGHMVVRFVAVGTAVGFDPSRAPTTFAGAPSLKVNGRPFTSALNGQDFVLLLRAGYRPVSIAMGNCVYGIGLSVMSPFLGNAEIPSFTKAFNAARETAMENLMQDLTKEFPSPPDRPVGIVGMTVEEGAHAGQSNVIEYTALGTAVAELTPDDPRRAAELPAPHVVVPVDV